jgi:hypothetical protein
MVEERHNHCQPREYAECERVRHPEQFEADPGEHSEHRHRHELAAQPQPQRLRQLGHDVQREAAVRGRHEAEDFRPVQARPGREEDAHGENRECVHQEVQTAEQIREHVREVLPDLSE